MVLLQLKLDIQIFNIIKVSRFDPGQREKINLDFCFNTSLWCLKRLYEASQRSIESKNLS